MNGALPARKCRKSRLHTTEESGPIMNSWNEDDLRAIAESHDLHISPFREDGTTYGTPTLVWPLVVDGEIYVRAANGQQSSWYVAALSQKAGRSVSAAIASRSQNRPRPSARSCRSRGRQARSAGAGLDL